MATITAKKLTIDTAHADFTTDLSTLAGATEHEITGIDKEKKLIVVAVNTDETARALVFKASDKFCARGKGDLTISLAQDTANAVVLEGARFVNEDGSIEFTVATGATGSLYVVELPD